jgi:SAM-dependent MidA family methyltransferase
MSPLKQKIIERIRAEGPINFETFMEMALYYPGLGYYTKDTSKIGREGDFYTSPHLHPIFGAMMGRQMEEMWELMGAPALFRVVEMGAGAGYLVKDMLEYLRGREQSAKSRGLSLFTDEAKRSCRIGTVPVPDQEGNFFECIKYTIVELNPAVKTRQQELLSKFIDKVTWVSGLSDLEPVTGCFFSNELLDAFPVRIIEMDGELKEIYLTAADDELEEVKMPCMSEIPEYLKEFGIDLPRGYRTEVNLRIKNWINEAGKKLERGFVLTVDYGYPARDYYSEERNRGTLLCYYRHRVHEDPYRNIGEQDMTAHVNFSSLKKWGEDGGLKTVGYCGQGAYLISLGIDEVMTELYGDSPDVFDTAKVKGLILPQGMGESHKVMVQYKGDGEPELRGFTLRNYSEKL